MIRVCHVVCALENGGIEKWLRNLVECSGTLKGDQYQFDFVTLLKPDGVLKADFQKLGCRVWHVPLAWRRLVKSVTGLREHFIKQPYDVVHCHADYLGGVVLLAARLARIPIRVNHIHTTRFAFDRTNPLPKRVVGLVLRKVSDACAGITLECSQEALNAFQPSSHLSSHQAIFYCGIPLNSIAFAGQLSRENAKELAGLPPGARYMIHVGRHGEEKNLPFLLDIFTVVAKERQDVRLLLAGSGPLTETLRRETVNRGLLNRVHLLGNRNDVPVLLRCAEVFVMTSFYEGLPVSLIEAQGSGLRCLVADHITKEVDLVPGLVDRLPLTAGASVWARRICELLTLRHPEPIQSLDVLRKSPFNLENGLFRLLEIYSQIQSKKRTRSASKNA